MSSTLRATAARPIRVATHTVEHLIFDFCGVLYDDSQWNRWLFGLVTRMGLHTHYAAFFRVWEQDYLRDIWSGRREFWDALREFLSAAGLSHLQVEEVLAATRGKRKSFSDRARPFSGVTSTLEQLLKSGVQLTIVSRVPMSASEIHSALTGLGLGNCCSRVAAPPVPQLMDATSFFEWLGERSPLNSTCGYVGRNRADLARATELGLLTVAFNHDADAVADIYLDQFDQLLDVIQVSQGLLAAG